MQTNAPEHLRNYLEPRGDEPVDEFDLPIRVHYTLISLIAFSVGFTSLLFAFFPGGEQLRHPVVIGVCISGMSVPFLYALAARRVKYEFKEWMIVAVLLLSIVGPFICHFFIGELRPAFLTLYMLGPIGVSYYVPLRRAWPVIVLGAAAILFVSARIDEPDAMMRGAIVATITVSSSLMLHAIKQHLVRTIGSNREIAERDPLTGAFNTHKLRHELDYEIAKSMRGEGGFALIEFDLDDFGSVNESYGHAVGDEVLISTAEAIQTVLSRCDTLVRRGADQFIVIAPTLAHRDLRAMTLQARDRIAIARRSQCPDLEPSACCAWAVHDGEESAGALLERADAALRDVKRTVSYTNSRSMARRGLVESRAALPRWMPSSAGVTELRQRRAEEAAIGDDPLIGAMRIAWNTAAASTIVLCAVILALGLTGNTSFPMTPAIYALFVGWGLVMAPASYLMPRYNPNDLVEHLLSLSTLLMVTITCLVVGEAAPALVEIYMMAALLYLMLLPFKFSAAYAAIAFGLYAAFLFSTGYPSADVRVVTTLVNFGFIGAILVLSRQAALKVAEEKAVLAREDELTGLANMRRLRGALDAEIERREQTGAGGLALLALDLDDFKAVNDRHSHSTGDEMLKAVAHALRRSARMTDLPARCVGDQFMILMTDTDEHDIPVATALITESVEKARLGVLTDITPTVTIGWAIWRQGESVDQLLDRANDALFDEKWEPHEPDAELA